MPKGVYDRAASKWMPRPQIDYPQRLVEQVRDLYGAGLSMREVAQAAGTTVKVLQRLMPRHGIKARPATPRDQTLERNALWKGDQASYSALHLRVAAQRGKPKQCQRCGTCDPKIRYEWANLTGHYEDVSDYERMCLPCHRKYDAGRRRETGRPTSVREVMSNV